MPDFTILPTGVIAIRRVCWFGGSLAGSFISWADYLEDGWR